MSILVDRRTMILDRLEEILANLSITLSTGLVPVGNFTRNRDELPAELVPGIILLDADEVRDLAAPVNKQGREIAPGPGIMKMSPEIYVVLQVRKPHNKSVGQDLNTARAEIVSAVYADKSLRQLVGANGLITYDGCVTDLARNRTMKGQMGLMFSFSYPMIPGEFAAT